MHPTDIQIADKFYTGLGSRVEDARQRLGRPLTFAEKVLYSHLAAWPADGLERGRTHLALTPDRVAMQDATAQMALLQFMVTGIERVSTAATVHCDHLIAAKQGAAADLGRAFADNHEVYEFLKSACARYGIGFWGPGSGIIHQVVLEQYAFPGGLLIGTDSHTPNAGGVGMLAVGVGGADAVEVMAGEAWGVVAPKIIGIRLSGNLQGWAAPKDLILKVAGLLTVKGGTGSIVEYFGPGARTISCTGKATVANMGAELGATTSLFPYDERISHYLSATGRVKVAGMTEKAADHLRADPEVEADPSGFFDQVLEIDLSALEPQWVGPHTPDLLHQVANMKEVVSSEGYPDEISCALIGSCTNSSFEDISRAASVARQAHARGVRLKAPLLITPGSDQVLQTIKRAGFIELFEAIGATVLANACGPCIGQWDRESLSSGQLNTIVTSYNRNFRRRNDGNENTLAFVGSPELVTAVAFAGRLSFDPRIDPIKTDTGGEFVFKEPSGDELPSEGFVLSREGYVEPPSVDGVKTACVILEQDSSRLAALHPFPSWDGQDLCDLLVLLKVKGKCTTDHISPAGPWLRFRGHLPNISENMFQGALNAFTGEHGKGMDMLRGEPGLPLAEIARRYRDAAIGWVVVGDENYGEGSSREHAAMSPRFLGCKVVLARSFARIHESNLKRQGILALTLKDYGVYERIREDSRISILGLSGLAPGKDLVLRIRNEDSTQEAAVAHTMTEEQIEWFRAGSALNALGSRFTVSTDKGN